MLGFKFTLESLYFTSFRKVTSTSVLLSYRIPPFTTIRGLISNALGLKRDNFQVQDLIKIGIKWDNVQLSSEMSNVLKLKKEGNENYKRYFPSSPIFKEFLVNPIFDIYVGGNDEDIIKIHNALKNPKRDLYIGSSDNLVDLNIFDCIELVEEKSNPNSVLEGIHEHCFIDKIPYKFYKIGKSQFNLEKKVISIPTGDIDYVTDVFDFYGDKIVLM